MPAIGAAAGIIFQKIYSSFILNNWVNHNNNQYVNHNGDTYVLSKADT